MGGVNHDVCCSTNAHIFGECVYFAINFFSLVCCSQYYKVLHADVKVHANGNTYIAINWKECVVSFVLIAHLQTKPYFGIIYINVRL